MADKIVVADDELDVLNLAKMILEKAGFQVVTASDGIEAEEKIVFELPDVVLLDVVMPRKGGFEVCKSIKEREKTRFIPVIMFTVLGRSIDRKMGEEAGADGHFTKPFEAEELVAEVRKHIEASRSVRFSRALGLEHGDVSGREILLEFDSLVSYERAVRDYVLEAKSNGDSPVVITNEYSAVHSALDGEEGIEFVPFIVPLVLSGLLGRHDGGGLCLVFDSINNLILSSGFQSAYNFVRDLLLRLSKVNSSSIFLLNPEAHASTEVQSIRTLFKDQISFNAEGLKRIRSS